MKNIWSILEGVTRLYVLISMGYIYYIALPGELIDTSSALRSVAAGVFMLSCFSLMRFFKEKTKELDNANANDNDNAAKN